MQNNNTFSDNIAFSGDILMLGVVQSADKRAVPDIIPETVNKFDNSVKNNGPKKGLISINSEIKLIDNTLANLADSMYKYIHNVKDLWNTEMKPFIESTDCLILEKLSSSDYYKFIDYMCEHKVYRLMVTSQKRLIARRSYLESQLLNNLL
jgi:hypothetical protein